VFIAGIGTAYAGIVLPTITLGGNVEVVGDLNCTNCIDSSDIASNAVGAPELMGISKLVYTSCTLDPPSIDAGAIDIVDCPGTGTLILTTDRVIVTSNRISGSNLVITSAWGINDNNNIRIALFNPFDSPIDVGSHAISVIAYDPIILK